MTRNSKRIFRLNQPDKALFVLLSALGLAGCQSDEILNVGEVNEAGASGRSALQTGTGSIASSTSSATSGGATQRTGTSARTGGYSATSGGSSSGSTTNSSSSGTT